VYAVATLLCCVFGHLLIVLDGFEFNEMQVGWGAWRKGEWHHPVRA
jgi:hypothetical protein